ncbi:phage protein Gp37 [Neisseria blantyrii]|uniref:phage protein Gp37 n=1 Tax=Neisseria blantyrii TaxID=2830647 RepID=UPI00272BE306|nr:phage protein Gp37 [Neisseria blantyrii]
MITEIEQAMVARLSQGLGRMVRTVKSYGGELEDLGAQIMTLPAVWVTYAGSRIEAAATGKTRYCDHAQFAVMCATRSLRNEAALHQGGTDVREIGSNALIWAVRRLLDGQTLGLADSRGLTPKAVRPIAKSVWVQNAAVSVAAAEYVLRFDSVPLEDGRFPTERDGADAVFARYGGRTDLPYPDFEGVDGLVFDGALGSVPIRVDLKG